MVVKPSFDLLYTYFGKLFYRTASFSVARFHLADYSSTCLDAIMSPISFDFIFALRLAHI